MSSRSNLAGSSLAELFSDDPASQLLLPEDSAYSARVDSYWSNVVKQKPEGIVCPASPEELARVVLALSRAGRQFSVRSGGHSSSVGANNMDGGVVIDLCRFNEVIPDHKSKTVQVGTACTWSQVYGEVKKHGLGVAGGRAGNVGVGGLLLGGGNSWLTAQKGWACDNMVEAEVILADGQIVKANRDERGDLFQALKGGSNNFGIVTRFTLATDPLDKVWGGVMVYPKDAIPEVCRLTAEFTAKIPENPENNLIIVIGYLPQIQDVAAQVAVVNTKGITDSPIYDDWKKLPVGHNSTKITSVHDLSFEVTLPENYYSSSFTLTFKNDKRIMIKAAELYDRLASEFKGFVPDGDFMTQCVLQPLPITLAQHSLRAGGNMLGLEDNECDGILHNGIIMMKTREQHEKAYPLMKKCVQELKDFAASIEGGLFRWLAINYADKSQDAIASYGEKNVQKMWEVSKKYDPDGVFQKLCPGGWKLPKLHSGGEDEIIRERIV
ncbi:FAD-binding domain-containing protein [Xylariaceae sp. FL1272]|nr:FAD-binding domain-containing protein [Xylariaceae sp. FL1272]